MQQIEEYLKFLELPQISFLAFLEVIIIAYLLYQIFTHTKESRFWVLTKGVMILAFLYLLVLILEMNTLKILLEGFFIVSLFALLMAFQPELRKLLEGIGNKKIYFSLYKKTTELKYYSDKTIAEIVDACVEMSKVKTGALIIIEKENLLTNIQETGIVVDGAITSQLLINIFEKNTPLHDGAVVISNNKISHATCILPLTNKTINKKYGTRHRAGLGATDEYQCISIIVSEETGKITLIQGDGTFNTGLSKEKLEQLLKENQIYGIKEKNVLGKEALAKKIKHNRQLKLGSSVMAVLIWLIIFNLVNPVASKTFKVPVDIINGDILIEQNAFFELGEEKEISIKIKAKSSILNSITTDKISVTADASKISITNAVPLSVDIEDVSKNDYEYLLSEAAIILNLENITAVDIPVYYDIINVQEGYHVHDIKTENPIITITAPASLSKNIDKVVAVVDATNKTSDFNIQSNIVIYDKNGDDITKDVISISSPILDLQCTMYKTKTIPLIVEFTLNKENFFIKKVELSHDTITIAAADDVLNNIFDYKIVQELEIKENIFSYMKQITLEKMLDCDLVKNEKITASVEVTEQNIEEYYINTSDIKIKNLQDDQIVTITDPIISLNLKEIDKSITNLDKFDEKKLKLYIDASVLQTNATKTTLKSEKNNSFSKEINIVVSKI